MILIVAFGLLLKLLLVMTSIGMSCEEYRVFWGSAAVIPAFGTVLALIALWSGRPLLAAWRGARPGWWSILSSGLCVVFAAYVASWLGIVHAFVHPDAPFAARFAAATDVSFAEACALEAAREEADLERSVAEHLVQVRSLVLKRGEPASDPHAAWILARGRAVAPYLVEHLVDDRRSESFEYFQFRHGDVAHELLCELYDRPLTWPVADREPIGGHFSVNFQDYVAFVREPGGRDRLRAMWSKVVAAPPSLGSPS